MVWNKSKPASGDKIRLSAAAIAGNFTAIEDDTLTIPMTGLQLKEQSSDPTNDTNVGFVYTKDDGNGNTELFYQDQGGLVKQLTAQSAFLMPIAWGYVNGSGTLQSGYNCTSDYDTTGKYDISFTVHCADNNIAPVVTAHHPSLEATARVDTNKTFDSTGFSLATYVALSLGDAAFSFVVYGTGLA